MPDLDPVVMMLVEGQAAMLHEAQEQYLNAHLADVAALACSPLSDEAFRRHPLISLLLACGSRGWEDSVT